MILEFSVPVRSIRYDAPVNRGYTYAERVGRVSPPISVLAYLVQRYPHSSPSEWRGRIEGGHVLVDGALTAPDAPLAQGQTLAWSRSPWCEPPAPLSFAVLYEDEDILGVDKPAGLPTLPGGGYLEHTLLARVRDRFPEAVPMHRLGRWTSGVVLFARTGRARSQIAAALRRGTLGKRYRALASGTPAQSGWTIEAPIGPVPHPALGTIHAFSPWGRAARSEVIVLEERGDAFLADVILHTGRPHQIRIHLATAGHPLVGDPLYAAGGLPVPGSAALPGDPGYQLHAAEVRLDHPDGRRTLRISSFPPPLLRTRGEAPPGSP